jgi:hypothetical protein
LIISVSIDLLDNIVWLIYIHLEMSERISRRTFLKAIAAGAVAGGATLVGLNPTAEALGLTDKRDVFQASEEFLRLHQSVINGLDESTLIEMTSNRYAKSFAVEDKRYTLALEKDDPQVASGYKRTLLVEDQGFVSMYTMYDPKTVYLERPDYQPMPMLPLNIDYLDGLSAELRQAYDAWSVGNPQ